MNRAYLTGLVGAACCSLLLHYVPQFEGTVNHGYKDPIGIVTACVGHTATAELGRAYTDEECETLLVDDLSEHAQGVLECITYRPLTTGERAAFVSMAFNIGVHKFCNSTLAEKANVGDMPGACAEISRWIRAGGQPRNGLKKRRAVERAICEGKIQ